MKLMVNDNQLSNRRIKISIVTCFNDREILEENLLKSIRHQRNVDLEVISLDNTRKEFSSIPSALNYGGKKAVGKYIMFVHQDVYLSGEDWLHNALNILDKLPETGAAGVAGVDLKGRCVGFIIDRGRYWGRPIDEPILAQTLDEQLIIVPKKVFKNVKFDQLFRFHSYVADYCLSVQKLGLKVYVLPLTVEHNSLTVAILNRSSIKIEDEILYKKHKSSFKSIYKTTGILGRKSNILMMKIRSLASNFLLLAPLIILSLLKITTDNKIILDVGCIPLEQHILKKYLVEKKFSVGVSCNRRYLIISKKLDIHNDYVVADPEKLPFRANSFDIALLFGLLEYLSKDKGKQIICMSERVAKEVIVKVPCCGSPIDTTHLIFRSYWEINDFKEKNYRTFSIGLKQPFFPCILFAYKSKRITK